MLRTQNAERRLVDRLISSGCQVFLMNWGRFYVAPEKTDDENQIKFIRYGSNQNFIAGKVYKWIAIADWR